MGQSRLNRNGTYDHGTFQINDSWIARLYPRFGVTAEMVRDNRCIAARVAGYILRYEINRAQGDFWLGVGRYHSHTPALLVSYISRVYAIASRMEQGFQQSPSQIAFY